MNRKNATALSFNVNRAGKATQATKQNPISGKRAVTSEKGIASF